MPDTAPLVTPDQLAESAHWYLQHGEQLYRAAQYAGSAAARDDDTHKAKRALRIAAALETAANIMRGQ